MKASIDFETYYDGQCSIREQSTLEYLRDPKFYAYMVAIKREDGFGWVGEVEDCPFEELDGTILFAHNRNFEEPLMDHLDVLRRANPSEFHCTLDMSAYRLLGRPLAEVLKNRYGEKMNKAPRDEMKGKHYKDLPREKKYEMAEYCLGDVDWTLQLAVDEFDNWPEHERQISRATSHMMWQGLPMNKEKLEQGIITLRDNVEKALDTLPWTDQREGACSPIQWAEYCRSRGKTPPKSMAKDNAAVIKWMSKNPEEAKVLEATHILRGAGTFEKKLQKMVDRIEPNGWLPYGLKYFGASPTGRDSGDKGFNTQNMPRDELYGVDLRGCIEAPEGKILLNADYSQIEARVCAWIAGEERLLDVARSGVDWYEAMARAFGMYKEDTPLASTDPELRRTMKIMGLGLQYKMGSDRLASMSGLEYEDAASLVRLFRSRVPNIVKLWGQLERQMKAAAMSEDRLYDVELPSGRSLRYENVTTKGGLKANIIRNGVKSQLKYWAGILIENIVQAIARDLFMQKALDLEKAGHNIILRIHDEYLFVADKSSAKDEMRSIQEVMVKPPEWCEDLPLGTEVHSMKQYSKS